MAAQGFPVQGLLSGAGGLGVRLLRLAQPGALGPGDPPRWLTDAIRQVHAGSRQTYGSRRVHAELTLGRGISVGYHAVELLMRRAGLQGVTGRPKFRRGCGPRPPPTTWSSGSSPAPAVTSYG
jgi:transposase InsO family protein